MKKPQPNKYLSIAFGQLDDDNDPSFWLATDYIELRQLLL